MVKTTFNPANTALPVFAVLMCTDFARLPCLNWFESRLGLNRG